MPQIEKGPVKLNALLKKVYAGAMKAHNNNKTIASKEAWHVAKKNGWKKLAPNKWVYEDVQDLIQSFEKIIELL
jgi:hypothetical protein